MAYTTPAQVRALAVRLPVFSATTTVTSSQVEEFISYVDAEINVALAKHGYAVPVSSPASFLTWLTKVATEGVAAMVLRAWYQDQSGQNSESAHAMYERRYRDAIKALREGDMTPGSVDETGGAGIASYTTDVATTALGDGGDADSAFSKAMVW